MYNIFFSSPYLLRWPILVAKEYRSRLKASKKIFTPQTKPIKHSK